jgi:thioredoxin reductase (NADPH)
MRDDKRYAVVIVGGGPSGLAAALESIDCGCETIVLEAESTVGGQLGEIHHAVDNVLFPHGQAGAQLRVLARGAAATLGDRVCSGHRVTAVDLGDRWVQTERCRIYADALVIATGATRRELDIAVHGSLGGDVTYDLTEPDRFIGRSMAVIGGGDSAVLDALYLSRAGSPVMLVHRSEQLTARRDLTDQVRRDHRIEDLAGWELDGLVGDDRLEAVRVVHPGSRERRTLEAGGIVLRLGRCPATSLFDGQLELDRSGAIVVDAEMRSSRDGVFAAGDCTAGSYRRLPTAIGQGVLAARSARRQLESAQRQFTGG